MISLSILPANTLPVSVFQGIGTSSFLSSVRSIQEKKVTELVFFCSYQPVGYDEKVTPFNFISSPTLNKFQK